MGVDIVWSVECLYRTKRQTVGEFIFFCPQTRVFLVVRPLYSDWDLYHWLPDSQALGFRINYSTSFPGPPSPREWCDFSASIITSIISHNKSLYSYTHTYTHTHTGLKIFWNKCLEMSHCFKGHTNFHIFWSTRYTGMCPFCLSI